MDFIQEISQMTAVNGDEDVLLVESGFQLLNEKKILWNIANFYFGMEREHFSEQTFKIKVDKTDHHRGATWTFNLSTPQVSGTTYDLVLGCANKINGNDDNMMHPDEDNVLYCVEASIEGMAGKWGTFNSTLTSLAQPTEIFRINNRSLFPLISGCLVLEITFKVLRKLPLTKRKMPCSSGAKRTEPRSDFRNFLNSKGLSDVKIISSDGTEFYAHRIILSAGSEAFDAMFKSEMTESQTGIIKLDDMSTSAVNFLLHFLYCGEILPFSLNGKKVESSRNQESCNLQEDGLDVSETEKTLVTVEEALYVASKYGLVTVLKFIDHSFRRVCRVENALSLFELSKMHSLECKEFLKSFIINHPRVMDKILDP